MDTAVNVPTTHDVIVREARFDDYDDVMVISGDIYGGNDYLHCLYSIFLQDKNSNAFVLTSKGKIVS